MINLANMRYLANQGVWKLNLPRLEIIVAGTNEAPDPYRIQRANDVIRDLDTIVVKAKEYLRNFVATERLDSTGAWDLGCIEFGRDPDSEMASFEMQFQLDNDIYGLWTVRFRCAESGYWPVLFSREQY